jgi:hypothetical protein
VFFRAIFLGFCLWLDSRIWRRVCLDFLRGSWIDVLCIFVLDLDPSNTRLGLRLTDSSWNPRLLFEHGRISIPFVSVGLMLPICRDSIS